TVPFARYVVTNRHLLNFPFKRYQIQPVWRADRPQKGRYREFYQCDADVIGSDSLLLDAELVNIIRDVFEQLKMAVTIRLNNRKILDGISEYIGVSGKTISLTTAIDKLDKIGLEGVRKELFEAGFTQQQVAKIVEVITLTGDTNQKINALEKILTGEKGKQGIMEIKTLFGYLENFNTNKIQLRFDLTLARGLSYYTGTIYETVANDVKIGSILGGGRYDDLTGIFGLPNTSGVGISFGIDRIYDVLNELQLFPASALNGPAVIIIPFDKTSEKTALQYGETLRKNFIGAEIYPEVSAKLAKKFKYAEAKNITYAMLIGEEELQAGILTLKNLQTGEQQKTNITEVIGLLRNEPATFYDLSD
ncbi:MAG: histidine--tRNA ligase, partial [Chitinophagales bacterium]